jgi:hypothetical protein
MSQHVEVAAVVDVVEQATVTPGEVDRFQEEEFAPEPDFAVCTSRSKGQVDDRVVGDVFGVDRIEELATDFLLGPRISEALSVRDQRAAGDLDAFDLREGDDRHQRTESEYAGHNHTGRFPGTMHIPLLRVAP